VARSNDVLKQERFADATRITEWLHSTRDTQARNRVVEIVEAMQALAAHSALLKKPGDIDQWAKMSDGWRSELYRLEADVNSKLERYVMQEVMLYYPGTGLVLHAAHHPRYGQNEKYSETTGPLFELFQLALKNEVWRLRKCEVCTRWFYAKKKTTATCGPKCSTKAYRSTKAFQAEDTAYHRRYYRMFQGLHQDEWRRYYEWFDAQGGRRPEARSVKQVRRQLATKSRRSHGKRR
jgi:hypothetical protein